VGRQACPTCLGHWASQVRLSRRAHPARLAHRVVYPTHRAYLWTGPNWQLYQRCLECEVK